MTPSPDKIHKVRQQFNVVVDGATCTPTLHQIELAMQLVRCVEPRLFTGDGARIIHAIIEQHFCE
jgi:hypothetical protein